MFAQVRITSAIFIFLFMFQTGAVHATAQTPAREESVLEWTAGYFREAVFMMGLPVLASWATARMLAPIDAKIKRPNQLGIVWGLYVFCDSFVNWGTTIVIKALGRPLSDAAGWLTTKANAGISNQVEPGVSEGERGLTRYTIRMDQNVCIRAQQGRANYERAVGLFVRPNWLLAKDVMEEGNIGMASDLLAASAVYLRLYHREIKPNSAITMELATLALEESVCSNSGLRRAIWEKIAVHDIYFNDVAVQAYYEILLNAWRIEKCECADNCRASSVKQETIESVVLKDVSSFDEHIQSAVKYSPGLIFSFFFSMLEKSHFGQWTVLGATVEKMVRAGKVPVMMAISEPLNKLGDSKVQKLFFDQQNPEVIEHDESVDATLAEVEEMYAQAMGIYSNTPTNGRANLARVLGTLWHDWSRARQYFEKGRKDKAVHQLAQAVRILRITHPDHPTDERFTSMFAKAHFGSYFKFTAEEQAQLLAQIKVNEGGTLTDVQTQYYTQLLDAWGIIPLAN